MSELKSELKYGTFDRWIILYFRFAMAWTFIYAASHQVFDPKFSVAGFLSHTKTFHDVYMVFTAPSIASISPSCSRNTSRRILTPSTRCSRIPPSRQS